MLFKCIMFSWLLNYLVPARLGDIARGAALKTTEGAPLSVSLSTVVVERIYHTMTLAFLLAIASLFFYKEQLFWLELFSIAIFIGLLSVLFIIYKKDCYIIMTLGTRIPSLNESMYLMKDGLSKIMKNKSAMALCFAVSIPVWLFEISSIFFASKAIDFDISFLFATVSGIAAFIAQSLPITPAGIGVHEASITGILALFGVPTSTGMSIALIDHFARGFIVYTFGLISAIHIGFASRSYFKQTKDNKMTDG